ncbi:hypothetical protein NDU88_006405 [Pleurodeles waltl]|uniref:Uncharacterized protein n=1 Tax=Pleurodeles waltl TaxID=8319 RepID=A0AAV7QLV9_PLEWA|nr:hypothetical protein NDU88_006405 [Pleurodeles waltl]
MAPKNPSSNQMKLGVGERRLPQSLPLGAASNTGKKMTLKPQGALGNKHLAQAGDAGSGTGTKGVLHHGDGPTIPDMFKNPQPIMHPLPLAERTTMSTNLMQSHELVERSDFNSGLAFSASNNSLSQVSVDSNECCLDMTAASVDLTLTGLCVSAPSSIFEGLSTVIGEGESYTPQVPSLGETTMPAQGFENFRCNGRAVPVHSLASEGLRSLGNTHVAASNIRAGNNVFPGQSEVLENFVSLSDQSRDSDDSSASLSID